MSYAKLGDLQQRLSITTTQDDTLLQASLDWADEFIFAYTDRKFAAYTATRYFGPEAILWEGTDIVNHGSSWYGSMYLANRVLLLDEDLLTITALHNADSVATLITSGNYFLEPWNASADGKPYSQIRLKTSTSWSFDTDSRISVAGTWGYSATPDAQIINTAILLAEWHYRQRVPQNITTLFDSHTKRVKLEGFPQAVLDILSRRARLVRL